MGAIASRITSLTIVYSTVYSDADQRKHQSSASLAFVWGIHRGPVNSLHKWPVTRKMFPFHDVIMISVDYTHGFTDKCNVATTNESPTKPWNKQCTSSCVAPGLPSMTARFNNYKCSRGTTRLLASSAHGEPLSEPWHRSYDFFSSRNPLAILVIPNTYSWRPTGS